jgi:tagatose-1,6-bisphosphate aldolase
VTANSDRPGNRPGPDSLSRLGTIRRLDRCATHDGFLAVAAIDHPASMIAPAGSGTSPDHGTLVATKLSLIDELATHASGLLLDPVLSLGPAIASGRLPGSVGMIANIELMHETTEGFDRRVGLRPQWTPERIAAVGSDGVKFVFFHREELTEQAAEHHAVVAGLARRCAAVELPLIIEPLWYPLEGEDVTDPRTVTDRAAAIVRTAAAFAASGADVLKVQFPGSVGSVESRREAAAAVHDLDTSLVVPWVVLSEGAGFDEFELQVEISAQGGSSGFMAGRALWADVVGALGDARVEAIAEAGRRLRSLTGIVRANGRPWRERPPLATVVETLAEQWYAIDGDDRVEPAG